jgi:hypothetical protein
MRLCVGVDLQRQVDRLDAQLGLKDPSILACDPATLRQRREARVFARENASCEWAVGEDAPSMGGLLSSLLDQRFFMASPGCC